MNDEREGAGFLDTVNAEDQMKGLIQKQKTMSTIQENPPPPPPLQKCPRCDSINTKFCYYNNYSLSQPRYFCKTCRRYWTKGGTLRNVPVGGGCRKGKRTKKSIPSSSSTTNDPITSNDIGTFTSFMASSISGAGEGGLTSSIPQIQTLSVNDLMGFECPFNSSINQLIPLYQDFSIGKERTVNQFLQMDSSFSSMIKPPSLNEDWKPAYENPNADYWNNNNLPGVGPSSSSSSLL